MTRARNSLLTVLLMIAAGCDVVAENGQTIEAANGGTVLVSNSPNAVRVRPGGTLIVRDADLIGLGRVVTTIPSGPFPQPGEAIAASGGTVRIEKGRIAGGNVLVQVDPNSFPIPAAPGATPGEVQFAERVGVPIENAATLAGALTASNSVVDINGGTLISSSVFGRPNPYVGPGAVVNVFGGRLNVRGGEFLRGVMQPPSPLPSGGNTLTALGASVEISGGNFDAAPVLLAGSRTLIAGGRFGSGLTVGGLLLFDTIAPNPIPRVVPCYDIAGGSLSSISVSGPDPVFIIGTQFNLPLGRVTTPAPGPGRFEPALPVRLTGVLADGTPIDLDLLAPPETNVTLVAPLEAGACGLITFN